MTKLPEEFVAYCHQHFEDATALLEELDKPAPTSIRINRKKLPEPNLKKVPWSNSGYYLGHRPTFTEDPLFHAGAYYVQEASSMLLSQVQQLLPREKDLKILDLCAAPGGKSTLLHNLYPTSLLVANEIVPKRAKILAENITKWGCMNNIVTNASPEQIAKTKEQFDLIVVDAPCSGEGMFRKDKNARSEWSPDNVEICTKRQEDIVETIYDNLKEGGVLAYSTCTFNHKENEKNVQKFIDNFNLRVKNIEVPKGILATRLGYRMLPHRIKGEGFFISFLEKTENSGTKPKLIKTNKAITNTRERPEEFGDLFKKDNLFRYDETLHLFDQRYQSTLFNLQQKVRIVQFGHQLGKFVKSKYIPAPTLFTLSKAKDLYPHLELDHDNAITFLKKGNISLTSSLEDGWYFATFNGVPIGLLKKIGHRSNNYFPKEWRIINPRITAGFSLEELLHNKTDANKE